MTTRPTYRGTSLSCPTCHETYTALGATDAAEQAAAQAGPTCCQTSRPASLGEDDQGGNQAPEPHAGTAGARTGGRAPAVSPLRHMAGLVGLAALVLGTWGAFVAALGVARVAVSEVFAVALGIASVALGIVLIVSLPPGIALIGSALVAVGAWVAGTAIGGLIR